MIKGWGRVSYVEEKPVEKSRYHPPGSNPVPDEDIDLIIAGELNREDVAAEFGITLNALKKRIIRRKKQIAWNRKGCPHLTPQQRSEIAVDPRPVKVIADDYGITLNRVYKIIRRETPPGMQPLRERVRRFSDDQIRAIRADERKQVTIAEEYGIAQSTVWAIKSRRMYRDVQEIRDD